jgi:signal peptidase II
VQAERRKGAPIALVVAALTTLAVDQLSKALTRIFLPKGSVVSIGGVLKLRQVRNPGTAFGVIQGEPWPLFLLSIAVFFFLLLVLWRWGGPGSRFFQMGMGLIIGGALGNIIDRIALGAVVDFIDFGFWPVFNLADMAIVVGVIMTMVVVVKETWKKENQGA